MLPTCVKDMEKLKKNSILENDLIIWGNFTLNAMCKGHTLLSAFLKRMGWDYVIFFSNSSLRDFRNVS